MITKNPNRRGSVWRARRMMTLQAITSVLQCGQSMRALVNVGAPAAMAAVSCGMTVAQMSKTIEIYDLFASRFGADPVTRSSDMVVLDEALLEDFLRMPDGMRLVSGYIEIPEATLSDFITN